MKILIIDDTPENLEIGTQEIKKYFPDFIVETCSNFREAMEQLTPGSDYDVVLTDLNMPICETSAFHPYVRGTLYKDDEVIPYGMFIVFRAASVGVKKIAIVTDKGHHASAANAALECLGFGNGKEVRELGYSHFPEGNRDHPPFMVSNIDMRGEIKANFKINDSTLLIADSFKHKGSISKDEPKFGFQGALRILLATT
ncbi:MAG: Response regulator receiver domain [Candidatus Parcubacteria bacterium]